MRRILVVEDEPHIARLILFKLEREGFPVRWVESGTAALEALRAERFELVVLDLMLPDVDGYDLLQRRQADPELGRAPALVLSAKGQPQDVERALRLGAADYMLKPFTPQALVDRVKELVGGAGTKGVP